MTGVSIIQFAETSSTITLTENRATILQGVENVGPPGGPGGGGGAPTDASYVTLGTNGTLTDERVLTAGTGITITDAGAGSTVTVGVTANTYQPLDSDLTAIAALSTTSFGRALLELADAAAGRTALGLGSLATASTITTSEITDGTIVNADISASAAIAYSKLALTGAILNADLAGSIALSKLSTSGTPSSANFLRGDGSWSTPAGATFASDSETITGTESAKATAPSNIAAKFPYPGRPKDTSGSVVFYSLPGVCITTSNDNLDFPAQRLHYAPILVAGRSILVDQVACEVATAVAASTVRFGIYAADEDWQPSGAPVADWGTIDSTGTGVKTIGSLSTTLTPGRYLLAGRMDGGASSVFLRAVRGAPAGIQAIATTIGASALNYRWYRSSSGSGALPSSSHTWDTYAGPTTTGHLQFVFLRISDPSA